MEKREAKATKKPNFLKAKKPTETSTDVKTVNFMSKDEKSKSKVGDKRDRSKSAGSSGKKFRKTEGGDRKEEKSKARIRRESYQVSELVKKLRLIYNKLLIKKRDAPEEVEGSPVQTK